MTSLSVGGGAKSEASQRNKNTSARLCAKNAGGAYVRGGAYLRDTTVYKFKGVRVTHPYGTYQDHYYPTYYLGYTTFGNCHHSNKFTFLLVETHGGSRNS